MNPLIKNHYEKAIKKFTSAPYYSTMIAAKKEYFDRTGVVHEDEEDYEIKMNAFNDWYILQYVSREGGPFIKFYIEDNNLGEEIYNTFMRVNYSLFEYMGTTFKGINTFKDILHSTKISLAKDHRELSILKKDILIGRIINYQNQFYFLDGMTFLPYDTRSLLVKESKRVRKAVDPRQEYEFLMNVEKMKTRYSQFGHVDMNRFFKF